MVGGTQGLVLKRDADVRFRLFVPIETNEIPDELAPTPRVRRARLDQALQDFDGFFRLRVPQPRHRELTQRVIVGELVDDSEQVLLGGLRSFLVV